MIFQGIRTSIAKNSTLYFCDFSGDSSPCPPSGSAHVTVNWFNSSSTTNLCKKFGPTSVPNVSPDLDPNSLTLRCTVAKDFFLQKVILKSDENKKHEKLPSMQTVNSRPLVESV